MSHSPRPWTADTYKSPARITAADGDVIAMVYLTSPHTKRRDMNHMGNAALFTAAPDLLAALKALLPYAESRCEDLQEAKEAGNEDASCPGAAEAWARLAEARTAIAQAEAAQ